MRRRKFDILLLVCGKNNGNRRTRPHPFSLFRNTICNGVVRFVKAADFCIGRFGVPGGRGGGGWGGVVWRVGGGIRGIPVNARLVDPRRRTRQSPFREGFRKRYRPPSWRRGAIGSRRLGRSHPADTWPRRAESDTADVASAPNVAGRVETSAESHRIAGWLAGSARFGPMRVCASFPACPSAEQGGSGGPRLAGRRSRSPNQQQLLQIKWKPLFLPSSRRAGWG